MGGADDGRAAGRAQWRTQRRRAPPHQRRGRELFRHIVFGRRRGRNRKGDAAECRVRDRGRNETALTSSGMMVSFDDVITASNVHYYTAFRDVRHKAKMSNGRRVVHGVIHELEDMRSNPNKGQIDRLAFVYVSQIEPHAPCLIDHVKPLDVDLVIPLVTMIFNRTRAALGQCSVSNTKLFNLK
ncbi:hypothetical protein EVAR_7979_1 [Eumeta japonica]|uniref:Uncharacterized protein n=1 Tax=Eumeta variegata TaxID=151549 RepID=A0A4C1THS8_EUMVA|nr:hypothetical protein EVAR_7979_1 [Eumeta japonica]